MRLLFVTATRIGDAVLSTGLLDHLLKQYPDARVTVAAGPAALPLFAAVPGLERLIPVAKRSTGLHWFHLWRRVAFTRWAMAVDLKGSALTWLIPARRRLVGGRPDPDGHRVESLGRLVRADPPPAPRLWTGPSAHAGAERHVPGDGPVLALGVTANWTPKVWPAERFIALAHRLTAADGPLPGARIAVFGGPGERDQAAPVLRAFPGAMDLVGGVDLLTAAACLGRCTLFVGNDSGLMHMAAAAGTPTLGLFGPSEDRHYAPWGPCAAAVRTPLSRAELFERGDNGGPVDHRTAPNLMGGLTVERVEAAVHDLWRRCGAGEAA